MSVAQSSSSTGGVSTRPHPATMAAAALEAEELALRRALRPGPGPVSPGPGALRSSSSRSAAKGGLVHFAMRLGAVLRAWFWRLELEYDKLISSFAFMFDLRP